MVFFLTLLGSLKLHPPISTRPCCSQESPRPHSPGANPYHKRRSPGCSHKQPTNDRSEDRIRAGMSFLVGKCGGFLVFCCFCFWEGNSLDALGLVHFAWWPAPFDKNGKCKYLVSKNDKISYLNYITASGIF